MKLKELLGSSIFNKLKDMMGAKFSNIEDMYNEAVGTEEGTDKEECKDGVVDEGVEDNDTDTSKEEDDIEDADTDISEGGTDVEEGEDTHKDIEGEGTTSDDNVDEDVDSAEDKEFDVVLGEGWLREDGSVDLDKVLDGALRGYIEGLHNKIADIDNQMLIELLKGEAKSQGAVEIDDVLKFIDLSTVDRGNVADSVAKLKESKGYLFKEGSKGFNPSKNMGKAKYRQGMSFGDAYDMTE